MNLKLVLNKRHPHKDNLFLAHTEKYYLYKKYKKQMFVWYFYFIYFVGKIQKKTISIWEKMKISNYCMK